MQHVDQVVQDFIAYCASQSGSIDWPAIYDGMCRAAARKSFRGMGYAELQEAGIYLDIYELHRTRQLVQVVRQASHRASEHNLHARRLKPALYPPAKGEP